MSKSDSENLLRNRICKLLCWRVRWSLNLQNLRFEIDSTKEQVARIEEMEKFEEMNREKVILEECNKYLDSAERAFRKILGICRNRL